MKKILITGVTGFVGCHLAELALLMGYKVIGIGSLERKGDSLRIEDLINNENFIFIRYDLRSSFSDTLIEKIGDIDTIFSIASDSSVADSVLNPRNIIINNVELITSLLDYAKKIKVNKFIHLSTDEVYGEVFSSLHKEGWTYAPSNPYSASKMAQEGIIYSYWRTFNVPSIIVNCMNMYGRKQNTEKMIPKAISFLAEDKIFNIYSDNGKIGSRIYLHVSNLANALLFLNENTTPIKYQSLSTQENPLKYNVVGENFPIDNLQLYLKIANIMNKKPNYELIEAKNIRPGYDKNYGLDDSLIKNLGWKPKVTLEEGLLDTILWSLKNKWWLK
jgi:dTDP-glucose 4,6-dehydratase